MRIVIVSEILKAYRGIENENGHYEVMHVEDCASRGGRGH